jgi:branched-chain amino acid transport system permease protein
LLVGIPCLRLKGPYLGLATLAFPIMLMGIIFTFPKFFGGELGISGITRLASERLHEYYIAVIMMLVLCYIMWKITDSKIGIIFHAIREDEIAVRASGINTIKYKLLAFCLSGFFAGLAGGLYTHFMRIAGPSMLAVLMSFQAIIWTIFGGIATIYGAVAGVFILYPTLEFLRAASEYRMLIFALIVLLVLRLMPEGITTFVRNKLERECPRCKVRNAFNRKECRVCYSDMR